MTYAQHARQYFEAGWSCVLPVPPAEKTPPPEGFTGEHGADVVPVDVRARWEQSKSHYSIALRMPAGVIAIDVDHYSKTKTLPTGEQVTIDKRGDDTLREHETRLGPLPATWASTARGTGTEPGPSRTLFYRAPPGRYATTLGDPTTCAVEILQRHHRYAVVWPSHHQGVGAPYRWYTPEGVLADRVPRPGELAELPDAWVAALAQGASRSSAAAAPVGEGAVLLSVLLSDDWPECAEVTNVRFTACEEMASASAGSRHDTTSRRVFQLVRAGAFGHTGCGNALEELRQQWEALTSGENRGHEFDNMALSAARKAVTEVATTGLTAPAAYDPCLMMQVVLAPKPTQWVPDDAETPVLDIPAAAPPTVWSRRALIGTEAFDPRGLIDHKLAAASLVRMRPVLRYLTDTGSWVVREAHAWEINGKDQAAWAITELYELMPDGDPDSESEEAKNRAARKTKFGNAKTSGGIASKMHAMVYTSGHPCSMRASALDADPEILWAGRMAWDLRRCENRPQMALLASDTPHLHSAGVAPSGLGLEHPTPHWDAFLAAVWPDASIREWALHVLSVGLTGYSDAVLPLLMGPSGAGKTSTVNLVMSVLGSYGIAADPRLLVSADNTHASIVFALKGARLAFIDEAPRRGELATARLKQLTGGASMTGNPMRGNPLTFSPTHTLVLTCNVEESPNFADPALRRRVRLIPCEGDTDAVAGARRAITRDVWTAEAPGVLAQLMHYAARWLAEPDTAAQYRAPDSIRWRAEDIAAEEDPVRQWIESEMEFCEHGTNSTLLRAWFAEWLRRIEPRAPLMSATMFGRKLTDLGYPAHKSGTKSRPLRRRQSSYGPPVPPPQRPQGGTRVTDLPPLVTRDDHQSSADADHGAPTGNDKPQTRPNTTDDHANQDSGIECENTSTERSSSSPERPPSRSNEDQPDGRGVSHKQTDVEINLADAKSDNTHDISLDSVTKPLPSTKSTIRRECPEDQLMVLPAIISSNVDVKGQLDSYSPILATIVNDDLSSSKDHIVRIENKQGPNRPPSANDLNEVLDQGEHHPRQLDRQLGAPSAPQTLETGIPLTEQQATAEDHLTQLRAQRNQLTKLIKKIAQDDPLAAVYAFTRDQLVVSIKSAEKRLRGIRSEIAKRDSIAELGGDLLELPAHKTRHGPACSVTTEHAAEIVAATIAHRADPGRLTVDIETTGYPIGHPDHAVRTVQLGNRVDGVVFDVADPVQFATCVTLLAGATELEAYSAAVEVSHLAHLGMIDYRDAWRRVHDVVIKAQLHNPVGTLSSDAGLKPQAAEHVLDAVIPAAEVARAQLFRTAGWTTDTKVKNSSADETGGWVALERSGWAQVDPRCRTQVSYAASDVLDCAALGETLPMPSAAVYERERAVQAAVGAVSYRGIALDRGHIETKIAEHTPQRNAARSALAALGIDNPGSNDQIAAALLARGVTVGPNPGQLPIAGRSGKPSVSGDVLGKLRRTDDVAPLLDEVLRFREHSKALSTYLGPYHVLCTHGDGRVRTTIYTLQADTGRMSSVHPNLQNIPSHGGFRECFVADPGDLFIDADLFGIEVAVLAALSQDQVLLDLVASGRKLHKIIAAQVYGSNYSTRQYGYVKNGVFAKLYGAGVWRIANTVGCSEAEAQNMVDALDALAPGVKRWGYNLRDRVKDGMDSITLYSGRVLRLPADTPHKIVNYLVQGTSRELLCDGLLRWRYDTQWGQYGILVPVHDEILASVPAADATQAMEALIDCMAGELHGVKIKAEAKWICPEHKWLSNDHELAKV